MQDKEKVTTEKILKQIHSIVKEKKCDQIKILNLEKIHTYLSYFIICTVQSNVQANAVARELRKQFKSLKINRSGRERFFSPDESGWLLLDFGDYIIHLMTPEMRSFYNLDKLWADAEQINF